MIYKWDRLLGWELVDRGVQERQLQMCSEDLWAAGKSGRVDLVIDFMGAANVQRGPVGNYYYIIIIIS